MSDETLFAQVLAPKNRADPYPLYARMRETPVSRQADGSYLVSTQAALRSLIFDPRLSSEDLPPSRRPATGNPQRTGSSTRSGTAWSMPTAR
ncbi:cytochrome P450 [Methylobacterium fujisawaense]|uniref:Cytochrome P450 n=1 Tax=Methylobacterium fujisawaense TaxID=107400 RepID=A0ABR6DBN8_9HYPH|nr:cytochrome P450 [Methylobacterium fujisawaense]